MRTFLARCTMLGQHPRADRSWPRTKLQGRMDLCSHTASQVVVAGSTELRQNSSSTLHQGSPLNLSNSSSGGGRDSSTSTCTCSRTRWMVHPEDVVAPRRKKENPSLLSLATIALKSVQSGWSSSFLSEIGADRRAISCADSSEKQA